ncbi:MAG TPA: glycosyl hydrolase family 8 [Polyangiaceae bacterium]|nr:glycosyl hydrolase family 8 [Polyangiaceae bacterium]
MACTGCVKHVETGASIPTSPPPTPTPATQPPHQPFAQHRFEYAIGTVLPSHKAVSALDQATIAVYETWKERHLVAGCEPGEYRVESDVTPYASSSRTIGYGMLVTSLLAGHDARAQQYFDGLFRYFFAHQSALTEGLMASHQDESCLEGSHSQSDSEADLDIAYALLLADKQWGSCGAVDYAARARWVINAIARADMHREGRYMLLGDWVAPADPANYDTTRPAHFIPGHFRGFQEFMQQAWWGQVVDNGYWLLDHLQATHSQAAGLLPDFVNAADSDDPRPPAPKPHEADDNGSFGKWASSVPLRIGTDYIAYGDMRAKRVLERMNTFVKARAEGEPGRIAPGYTLSGEPRLGPESMLFTAPLGVAAMCDSQHQDWLNRVWDRVEAAAFEGSTTDSVRLLSMIVMSGNWWVPDRLPDPCARH